MTINAIKMYFSNRSPKTEIFKGRVLPNNKLSFLLLHFELEGTQ